MRKGLMDEVKVDELCFSGLSSIGPLILPIVSPLLTFSKRWVHTCVCVCVYDVSICTKIIKRLGEGIPTTDGACRLAKGVCDLHCLIVQISVAQLTSSPMASQHGSVPLHSKWTPRRHRIKIRSKIDGSWDGNIQLYKGRIDGEVEDKDCWVKTMNFAV